MSDAISEQTLLAMPASEYMSAVQRHFFRNRLLRLARDCEQEMDSARRTLRTPTQADPLDAAVNEEACRHQLRFLERRQGLLSKVRVALRRLEMVNTVTVGIAASPSACAGCWPAPPRNTAPR